MADRGDAIMTERCAVTPLKLFFDGGCRPNPGAIEVAVVVAGRVYAKRDVAIGSNDEAEWYAAIYALEVAADMGAHDIILIGDSALVVNQASGVSKCRSLVLARHLAAFRDAAAGFERVRLRHVRRHRNLAGIALDRARIAGWPARAFPDVRPTRLPDADTGRAG